MVCGNGVSDTLSMRVESERAQVIEKGASLLKCQRWNGQQVLPGSPIVGRHDFRRDFAQPRMDVDHMIELEQQLAVRAGTDLGGTKPLQDFRELTTYASACRTRAKKRRRCSS